MILPLADLALARSRSGGSVPELRADRPAGLPEVLLLGSWILKTHIVPPATGSTKASARVLLHVTWRC